VAIIVTGRRSRRSSGGAPVSANILAGISTSLGPAVIAVQGFLSGGHRRRFNQASISDEFYRTSATGRITAQAMRAPLLPLGSVT
jgi:hypothetical protein